jgi:hypothetical protein
MLLTIPSVSATVTNIEASADTTAFRGSTPATQLNTIMGNDTNVGVWNYHNDVTQGKFGYIKFANISGIGSPNIPSNSIINSATMWLYTRAGESQTITFYTPSGPWDENTLNWINKPSIVTPYASVAQDGSTEHWTIVDVTNIVRKWNDGTIPNNGLVAVSNGGGGSASSDWNSKENLINKPYISVDYTAPSTQQIDKTQLPNPSPGPSPLPPEPPQPSNFYLYAGIGIIAILLVSVKVFKGRSSSQEKQHLKPLFGQKEATSDTVSKTATHRVEAVPQIKQVSIVSKIDIKTAFGYKGATIIFKIKIENNTSDPISDIKVYPYVPDVFLLEEKEKSIALIEQKSSQTVTFEIRPTGECGDCNVSGRVNYYDMASRKRQDIELESKSLSIVCPMLHGKEISEADWHEAVSNFVKTEESTKEIEMPAESLFTMTSRIIKDMHMYMQKPEITQNQQLFNGVVRFYGEGVKGLKYAAQVEVVGGAKKSKLILKAWAEKEEALTGFYHGILDEIEKRINVKGYINDSIVQQYIHVGPRIGTQVKDSFVQRSNIGARERTCSKCGKVAGASEKFCNECGAKLEDRVA